MVKLQYTGPGKQRIYGVGDFVTGTVHEAPEAIAAQFQGLKDWKVIEPSPAKNPKEEEKTRSKKAKNSLKAVVGPKSEG